MKVQPLLPMYEAPEAPAWSETPVLTSKIGPVSRSAGFPR